MRSLLDLLSRRPAFRRLWLGEAFSLIGDWLSYVAVSLLALQTGDGAFALAFVFAAHVLPSALVAPWAGALADRVDRRTILVATQIMMAALMVAMVIAAAHHMLIAVELLLFARTAVGGFFYPAKQAAMRELVAADELIDANAIDTATWSLTFTFGTALGGVIAMAGPVIALSVDAVTFAAAAVVFSGLPRLRARGSVADANGETTTSIGAAFRAVLDRPALLEATLTKAPVAFAGGAAWVLLNFAAERLAASAQLTMVVSTALALGLIQAVRGIGTGVGPVLAKRLISRGVSARALLRASAWLCFAAIASFSLAVGWASHLVCVLLWGIGSGGYWVFSSAEMQRLAPSAMMGRIAAIDQLAMTLAMSLSAFVGAAAVSLSGSQRSSAWAGVAVGLGLYLALRALAARRARVNPSTQLEPLAAA